MIYLLFLVLQLQLLFPKQVLICKTVRFCMALIGRKEIQVKHLLLWRFIEKINTKLLICGSLFFQLQLVLPKLVLVCPKSASR